MVRARCCWYPRILTFIELVRGVCFVPVTVDTSTLESGEVLVVRRDELGTREKGSAGTRTRLRDVEVCTCTSICDNKIFLRSDCFPDVIAAKKG